MYWEFQSHTVYEITATCNYCYRYTLSNLLSGLVISSTAQLIKLGGELVLVQSGVLQGQLHLVQLLGGLLGLHLEPGLGAGHVSHVPVQVFNLDVVFMDGNLKLLNDL